jgi:phosphatidylglycerol:prolipoprotein diacylglycerol transferase
VRPVLFDIGSLSVHSYGVLVAVAFVCAWFVLRHELERRAGRGAAAYPLAVAAAAGGFVGARVYWFFEHLGDASATDSFSGAGFTWYGGLLGGAAAMLVVARRKGVSITTLLGGSAPALALGYGVGRIACQFAGDGTYGTPSDLPYLALAGAERFLVEFVRRNAHVLLGLTKPQLFAAAMMLAGAVLLAAPDQAGRSRLRTSRASAG